MAIWSRRSPRSGAGRRRQDPHRRIGFSIVRQLLSAGLLDELRLLVHPIAARNGTRLFEEGEPMYPFTLLKTESFPTGVVRLCLRDRGSSSAAVV